MRFDWIKEKTPWIRLVTFSLFPYFHYSVVIYNVLVLFCFIHSSICFFLYYYYLICFTFEFFMHERFFVGSKGFHRFYSVVREMFFSCCKIGTRSIPLLYYNRIQFIRRLVCITKSNRIEFGQRSQHISNFHSDFKLCKGKMSYHFCYRLMFSFVCLCFFFSSLKQSWFCSLFYFPIVRKCYITFARKFGNF